MITALKESASQRQEISQLKDEYHALQQQIEDLKGQTQQIIGSPTTTKQSKVASSPAMDPNPLDLNALGTEVENRLFDGHTS